MGLLRNIAILALIFLLILIALKLILPVIAWAFEWRSPSSCSVRSVLQSCISTENYAHNERNSHLDYTFD